ncbi:hypothetical protein D9M70_560770 [compost metagenome]
MGIQCLQVGDGRHQHDGATVTQQRQRFLDGVEDALDVDVELLVELLFIDLIARRRTDDTGVGDQHVEAAEAFTNLPVQGVQVLQPAGVGTDANCAFTDEPGRLRQHFPTTPGDDHLGAFQGESLRGGQADTAVAARDQGDLVFQLSHHLSNVACE